MFAVEPDSVSSARVPVTGASALIALERAIARSARVQVEGKPIGRSSKGVKSLSWHACVRAATKRLLVLRRATEHLPLEVRPKFIECITAHPANKGQSDTA
jgi:hypothetical protein